MAQKNSGEIETSSGTESDVESTDSGCEEATTDRKNLYKKKAKMQIKRKPNKLSQIRLNFNEMEKKRLENERLEIQVCEKIFQLSV